MKRRMKWIALSMLSVGMLGVGATGLLTSKQVIAETPPTIQNVDISSFVMEKGAGVRVSGDGLRFSAEMDKTTYEALEAKGASYGMLIVPENYLTEGYELTEANVFINNKFYFEEENPNDGRRGMINLTAEKLIDKDGDNKVEIYGAMTNIGTANIYREFVGVAYVQVPTAFDQTTGEPTAYEYKFAQYFEGDIANNTRSMYYTAQRTLELTDWNGDKTAVETNYITAYDAYIADFGYTFGYTEKHVLTKLDGSKETLSEELKYAALNSEVTASGYYNDPALYSMYYCTDKEMPTSKVYANGKTTLEVNYKEVDVDMDNMRWNTELTESNYAGIFDAYQQKLENKMWEAPFSVTTAIPEGGVAGTYLYFSGAADDRARDDIRVSLSPMYSKNYYQAIVNTGLTYYVKYDVYVENVDSTYTATSMKAKRWNSATSFASNNTIYVGQWTTLQVNLKYLVENWGSDLLFGLELTSYQTAGQRVNFYLGNVRIEEGAMVWSNCNSTSNMRAYSGSAGTSSTNKAAGSAKFNVVTSATSDADATALGDRTGDYLKYSQGQGWETMSWRMKPVYSMEHYQTLINSGNKYTVYFDIGIQGDGNVAPYKWVNGSLTKQAGVTGTSVVWLEYSCSLDSLVKDWNATSAGQTYGPRLFAITGMQTDQSPKTYVWIGNMRLVQEQA